MTRWEDFWVALLERYERVCDRIGILARGQVVREGRLDDLTRSERRWRLCFAPGADAAAVTAAGLILVSSGAPDVWRCDASDPAELNAKLDRCRASGALIVALDRDERELEDVLAEAVSRPGGPA